MQDNKGMHSLSCHASFFIMQMIFDLHAEPEGGSLHRYPDFTATSIHAMKRFPSFATATIRARAQSDFCKTFPWNTYKFSTA
jgi:hypothetical protein